MTSSHHLRVVIVDAFDEAEMYAFAMRQAGIDVRVAATAAEGLTALDEHAVDVVVLGLRLTDMPGVEVVRRIKMRRHAPPVVLLVGHNYEPTLAPLREAGCDVMLMRPCLPEDLISEITRVISRQRRAHTRPAPAKASLRRARIIRHRSA